VNATLRQRAAAWLAEDPDPETRAELQRLLDTNDEAGLADRFATRLEFGTAGLRGQLGAGPNRMNRVLVRRAAAGLARYLNGQGAVVVGYDARHRSNDFAADTAAVLAGAGLKVSVLPRPLPTPVLAYAVRRLGAAAGVMVTASHNPPGDNGYKVYAADGAQIIPPADAEISAAIDSIGSLREVPLASGEVAHLDEDIVEQYLADAAAQSLTPAFRDVHIVYTPMHGVGGSVTTRLLNSFEHVEVVEAQAAPDPDFPTVSYPNPEEPGTLDLAVAQAIASRADVVLANDPDADRLGVAVPGRDGSWRALRGDEIGVLLADHVLRHTTGSDRLVVTTIVSSSLLARLAEAAGVHFAQTLTGFKWIVRAGDKQPDVRFVFGYEEALGYSIGTMVRDKDGMTAALLFAELVAGLKAEGRTVHDRLDELALAYGAHLTDQWSVRVDGPEAMQRLRAAPLSGAVTEDLLVGGDLPPTDALVFRFDDGARVTVRPSGTEPKLKIYFEVVEPVGGGNLAAARSRGNARLASLRALVAAAVDV
jgi:phosphomannomutase